MIAVIKILDGSFIGGFVRGGEDKLVIRDSAVEWPQKWQVTLQPDMILATSFRPNESGGNLISFELGLNGYAKLTLKTTNGVRKSVRTMRVFRDQSNLDGELYLIYNGNGFRSAYFYSREFLEWRAQHNIVNVVNQDPNSLSFRNRNKDKDAVPVHEGDLTSFVSGRMTTITDGDISLKNVKHERLGTDMQLVCVEGASWAILEKVRKTRTERVLVTRKPFFELDLPDNRIKRILQYSKYNLAPFMSQAESPDLCCG